MAGIQILGFAEKWVFVIILTPQKLNPKAHVGSDSSFRKESDEI